MTVKAQGWESKTDFRGVDKNNKSHLKNSEKNYGNNNFNFITKIKQTRMLS